MTKRYLTCAETAKLIRTALKASFPGVVFGVRSSTYSGGASIRVSYEDGPALEDVQSIACAFSGADFDGMQDLKTYRDSTLNGEPVSFGADFIFVNQDVSDARRTATEAALASLDDRQMNNLEAVVKLGRFGPYQSGAMSPANSDWALFVRCVALLAIPYRRAA